MTADVGAKCEPSRSRAGYHRRGRLWAEGRAMTTPLPAWDLTRILLAVVAVGGLIDASFWVLRPFLPAVIWATMIVVATGPAVRAVEARSGGWRSVGVAVWWQAMGSVPAGGVKGAR